MPPPTMRERAGAATFRFSMQQNPADIVVGRWPDPMPPGWRLVDAYEVEGEDDWLDASAWSDRLGQLVDVVRECERQCDPHEDLHELHAEMERFQGAKLHTFPEQL